MQTGGEVIAMSGQEYLDRVAKGEEPFKIPQDVCFGCKEPLDVFDKEGGYTVEENPVCQDCYFGAMGEEIDNHPIGYPVPRGGCGSID